MKTPPDDRFPKTSSEDPEHAPKIWFTLQGEQLLKPSPMTFFEGNEASGSSDEEGGSSGEAYCTCNTVCTCNPHFSGSSGRSRSGGRSRRVCTCNRI